MHGHTVKRCSLVVVASLRSQLSEIQKWLYPPYCAEICSVAAFICVCVYIYMRVELRSQSHCYEQPLVSLTVIQDEKLTLIL